LKPGTASESAPPGAKIRSSGCFISRVSVRRDNLHRHTIGHDPRHDFEATGRLLHYRDLLRHHAGRRLDVLALAHGPRLTGEDGGAATIHHLHALIDALALPRLRLLATHFNACAAVADRAAHPELAAGRFARVVEAHRDLQAALRSIDRVERLRADKLRGQGKNQDESGLHGCADTISRPEGLDDYSTNL
jgi:hypothetical protein